MKAILVIDLNEDVKLDELEIVYVIQDKFGTPVKAEIGGVKLKPMPKRKKTGLGIDIGYNKCIDDILGRE